MSAWANALEGRLQGLPGPFIPTLNDASSRPVNPPLARTVFL